MVFECLLVIFPLGTSGSIKPITFRYMQADSNHNLHPHSSPFRYCKLQHNQNSRTGTLSGSGGIAGSKLPPSKLIAAREGPIEVILALSTRNRAADGGPLLGAASSGDGAGGDDGASPAAKTCGELAAAGAGNADGQRRGAGRAKVNALDFDVCAVGVGVVDVHEALVVLLCLDTGGEGNGGG